MQSDDDSRVGKALSASRQSRELSPESPKARVWRSPLPIRFAPVNIFSSEPGVSRSASPRGGETRHVAVLSVNQ